MREHFAGLTVAIPVIAVRRDRDRVRRFRRGASAQALKTPWGEPDLQGIWTDESDTPLQRSPKFANQEFFTDAQRADLDKERSALLRRDKRVERGTELDVAGAYNALFMSQKRTGARTSLIVDPPNGRIPAMTPDAAKAAAADREFRLALLQSTGTCKTQVDRLQRRHSTIRPPRRVLPSFRRATTPRG